MSRFRLLKASFMSKRKLYVADRKRISATAAYWARASRTPTSATPSCGPPSCAAAASWPVSSWTWTSPTRRPKVGRRRSIGRGPHGSELRELRGPQAAALQDTPPAGELYTNMYRNIIRTRTTHRHVHTQTILHIFELFDFKCIYTSTIYHISHCLYIYIYVLSKCKLQKPKVRMNTRSSS